MRQRVAAVAAVGATLLMAVITPLAAQSHRGASYFPNVALTTQNGATVHFYDDLLKGKIVAINLIYTTCKYSCPLETARLAQVQRMLGDRMGRDVFFYSITIDPQHDTPAVLKEYAARFDAGPGWLFLTGKQDDIDLIRRKMGLDTPTGPSDPDTHIPALLIGNEATGQWMRNSSTDNPKFLARTIGDWLTSWQGPRRALKSYAEATPIKIQPGEYVFRSRCAACHTIGDGLRVGPDLLGVTHMRSRAWLTGFILAPDKVLAAGDPTATSLFAKFNNVPMPNLGLSPEEVAVVVNYLEQQSGHPAATSPAASEPGPLLTTSTFPVLDGYLRIQEALSADTVVGVEDAVRSVTTAAAQLGPRAASIVAAVRAFPANADLTSARAAFGRLSDAILAYAHEEHARIGDGVQVAYCPMLRKSWLQKGTEIRNPFYGKKMLDCGRLTEQPSASSR